MKEEFTPPKLGSTYIWAVMIHSKPQSTALTAVSLFILAALAVDVWLLIGLIKDPTSYFMVKLVLVPSLLVIVIIVASKSYFSSVNLILGQDKLSYHYLLGTRQTHRIADISNWQEQVVKQKKSTYRRLSVQLNNGKKLHLSNHENSHYDQVVNYLKKKVKR